MTRTVIDILVGLTLLTDAFVVVVAGTWLLGRWRRWHGTWTALRAWLAPTALPLAWVIAVVGTAGSLFLSEVAGFVPCSLCWYQRIAMYPLAVILGIATLRRDVGVRRYVVPIALIGLTISTYHYQLEWFPQQTHLGCAADGGCTTRWIFRLGFISIPFMAGSAFAAIAMQLGLSRSLQEHPS